MEGTFCIGRQVVCLFQQRKLLGFKGIPARPEKVQRLSVLEEDRFLTLMNDQLGAIIEILNRVLPDEGAVIAFILDDAGQAVFADLFRHQPFLDVVFKVADRAHKYRCASRCGEAHAALLAGEHLQLLLIGHGVYLALADRAYGIRSFGLIKNDLVAAVRALPCGQLISPNIDDISAGTPNILFGEESGLPLSIFPAYRAFDCELGHWDCLLIYR